MKEAQILVLKPKAPLVFHQSLHDVHITLPPSTFLRDRASNSPLRALSVWIPAIAF